MTSLASEPLEVSGAPLALFRAEPTWRGVQEIVIDGPGGTGKSTGIAVFLLSVMSWYPGLRVLAVRKTRTSLSESWLVTWEDTLRKQDAPPSMYDGARRSHRESYEMPNGSVLVPGGMETPTRHYSTDWDIVFYNEAFEGTLDEWEEFRRGLRHGAAPWQLLLADTNPREDTHWLRQRWTSGKAQRLESIHRDNPRWHDGRTWTPEGLEYRSSLSALTGVRRKRLYEGLWCAAEGQVWECWDQDRHIINRPPGPPEAVMRQLGVSWCCVAVDWGFTHAGAMLVLGVAADGKVYVVAEVYRTGETLEWWAEQLIALCEDWWPEVCVCDPSRPDAIKRFNEVLAERLPSRYVINPALPFARAADNTKHARLGSKDMGGLDRVRQYLADGRLMFLRDSLTHPPQQELRERGLPTCTVEEIPAYVYREDKTTGRRIDETDPTCQDHGADSARYGIQYVHGKARPEAPEVPPEPFGSIGGLLRPPSRRIGQDWEEE